MMSEHWGTSGGQGFTPWAQRFDTVFSILAFVGRRPLLESGDGKEAPSQLPLCTTVTCLLIISYILYKMITPWYFLTQLTRVSQSWHN